MIITKLQGGIGNQMFQYAIARYLARIMGSELKFDISIFNTNGNKGSDIFTPRQYELHHFNISGNIATMSEIGKFQQRKRNFFYLLTKKIFNLLNNNYHYYKETNSYFNSRVLKLKDNIYLDGYWQSENYFKRIGKIIKNDLTVKNYPSDRNKELLKLINNCDSVAVHIRRGDYIFNPVAKEVLGVLDVNYYQKGFNLINQKIKKPHYFIFSDDPEWARANTMTSNPTTYISHNGSSKSYEDMRLMSNCKYFIIANSSFSWWGAWLSIYKNKIVITPKKWFKNRDSGDIVPESWVKIDN